MRPGPVADEEGRVVGTHRGAPLYTVGQRRGVGAATGRRAYVTGADLATNTVRVGPREDLRALGLEAERVTWIAEPPARRREVEAQWRSSGGAARAWISRQGPDRWTLDFQRPVEAVAPGQLVAFYRGEEVLGGGTISSVSKAG